MGRYFFAAVLLVMLFGCAAAPKPQSEYNMGVDAYRVKDYAAARQHWSVAAQEREPSALNNLGFLLFNGLGGEPDPARAVSLWMEAAKIGHSEAQWHLGRAFEDGKGVEQDMSVAYAWYRCAIVSAQAAPKDNESESQIERDAGRSLTRLLEKLPAEQLESSEQFAKQYIAKYAKATSA